MAAKSIRYSNRKVYQNCKRRVPKLENDRIVLCIHLAPVDQSDFSEKGRGVTRRERKRERETLVASLARI